METVQAGQQPRLLSPNGKDIQAYLKEPPTFQELLETKALRRIYRWHMISLYCPENLMFRERVEDYKAVCERDMSAEVVRSRARKIIKDFCTTDSVMEINIDEKMKRKLAEDSETPAPDTFDAALAIVDKDICRSLQAFWVTEIFLAYYENKAIIDDLVSHEDALLASAGAVTGGRGRSSTVGSDTTRDEMLRLVRQAYGITDPLVLRRVFDVTSAFSYAVHQFNKDGPHIGWAVQRGATFFFFDLNEKQVLKILAAALLGKTAAEAGAGAEASSPAQAPVRDDDVAGSGCCGGGGASQPAAPLKTVSEGARTPDRSWYVRDSNGADVGPISGASMALLWKYHALPDAAIVSADRAVWQEASKYEDTFTSAKRIETIDPTAIPDF